MKADNDGQQKGGNVPLKPLTMEMIEEACREVRHTDKQLQFLEDWEAANKDDIDNARGYLVINPELDLSMLDDPLVHGRIIERNGKEYRVIIDEKMRGMKNMETGEMQQGWWIPPPTPLDMLKDVAARLAAPPKHIPTVQMHPEVVPMMIPTTGMFAMVRGPTDEEAAPAIAAMAKSIEKAVDAELTTEVERALADLKEDPGK